MLRNKTRSPYDLERLLTESKFIFNRKDAKDAKGGRGWESEKGADMENTKVGNVREYGVEDFRFEISDFRFQNFNLKSEICEYQFFTGGCELRFVENPEFLRVSGDCT